MAAKRGRARRESYAAATRPTSEFDFHDLGPVRPDQVRSIVDDYLTRVRAEGHARVRIITGKGIHSRGRPS